MWGSAPGPPQPCCQTGWDPDHPPAGWYQPQVTWGSGSGPVQQQDNTSSGALAPQPFIPAPGSAHRWASTDTRTLGTPRPAALRPSPPTRRSARTGTPWTIQFSFFVLPLKATTTKPNSKTRSGGIQGLSHTPVLGSLQLTFTWLQTHTEAEKKDYVSVDIKS